MDIREATIITIDELFSLFGCLNTQDSAQNKRVVITFICYLPFPQQGICKNASKCRTMLSLSSQYLGTHHHISAEAQQYPLPKTSLLYTHWNHWDSSGEDLVNSMQVSSSFMGEWQHSRFTLFLRVFGSDNSFSEIQWNFALLKKHIFKNEFSLAIRLLLSS